MTITSLDFSAQRSESSRLSVKASELVAALSFALDITEGQPAGHAARSCMIGMRLGHQLGLEQSQLSDLFYALLLKDLGCSSNAAKMCYLFGSDDRTIKHDLKTIDWPRMSESFRFLTRQVAPGAAPLQRVLKIAALLLQGPKGAKQLVETRCERGAEIARQMGFSPGVAQAIQQLDEHYNGAGHPNGRKGEQIDPLARILGLAQTFEVFYSQLGREAALAMAEARSGTWFDPALVAVLRTVSTNDRLWDELASEEPDRAVLAYEPVDKSRWLDERGLDAIAEGFARVVDAKSPWTFKHSDEVARIAVGMGHQLGYSTTELRSLRRMALLHDLGKLGVSNAVLDKPGKPTDEEFAALKKHPQYTYEILVRAGCFSDLADVAAAHHEKLDGRGYHRGIPAERLPLNARILCIADMYEAMTASRPYREGMPREKVLAILDRETPAQLCPQAVAALKAYLDGVDLKPRIESQLDALDSLLQELA